jgi:hypothetical protein
VTAPAAVPLSPEHIEALREVDVSLRAALVMLETAKNMALPAIRAWHQAVETHQADDATLDAWEAACKVDAAGDHGMDLCELAGILGFLIKPDAES